MHVERGAKMRAKGSAQSAGEGFVEPADGGYLIRGEAAGKAQIERNDLFYPLAGRGFVGLLRSFEE
jgi:hypothetical protein